MNKNRIMRLLSIAVPVLIAAVGEFSDVMDAKMNEEKMEDMENRIAKLEHKDSE